MIREAGFCEGVTMVVRPTKSPSFLLTDLFMFDVKRNIQAQIAYQAAREAAEPELEQQKNAWLSSSTDIHWRKCLKLSL